jgi:preprotein translocase SecE subunit
MNPKAYIDEVGQEVRKITWPDKASVLRSSIVVVFIVIVSTLYVTFLDVFFSRFFEVLKLVV